MLCEVTMDAVLLLLLAIIAILIIGLYIKSSKEVCRSKRRLDGLTCLVTGGTSGVGLQVAIDFAMRGARVIVACPFVEEGNNALRRIKQESGNDNVELKFLDLASFQSVRQFAADIIKTESRLHILMNNAGVGVPQKKTEDGINIIMQVNYLGHFLLTILLLPLLKKSGTPSMPSRIVNTSSILHHYPWLNVNRLVEMRANIFTNCTVYANSKLCFLLFSQELTKKLKDSNVVIHDADPGEMATKIFFSSGIFFGIILYLVTLWFFKIPFEGAQTLIHVAVDEKAANVCGKYFRNCKQCVPSKLVANSELAKMLWNESVKLVKLSDRELSYYLGNKEEIN